ncbi:MAG: hypothetical protein RIR25_1085 [Verrucomicrobiota bacterium]|jgi:hypothetical protein
MSQTAHRSSARDRAEEVFRPSIAEQIAEVQRELDMRRRVYPKWVKDLKLTQDAANRQIRVMAEALDTLQQVKMQRDIGLPPKK